MADTYTVVVLYIFYWISFIAYRLIYIFNIWNFLIITHIFYFIYILYIYTLKYNNYKYK